MIRKSFGGWEASCPACQWLFWSRRKRDVERLDGEHVCVDTPPKKLL